MKGKERFLIVIIVLLSLVMIGEAIWGLRILDSYGGLRAIPFFRALLEKEKPEAAGPQAESETFTETGKTSPEAELAALLNGDADPEHHLTIGLHGCVVTLVRQGEPYVEPGAFCIDGEAGPLGEPEIYGAEAIDTDLPGDYEVIYAFHGPDAGKAIRRTVRVVPEEEYRADSDGIAVLMYHYVYTADDLPDKLTSNWILDTDLEEQLRYLQENDYYYPSLAELRAYVDGKISLPEKSCLLTFDDGQSGFLKYGSALLEEYRIPAIAFLIGAEEGEEKVRDYASPLISYESHSYDMHRGGGTSGHGGIISKLTQEEIEDDLDRAIAYLGSADGFAYPYGDVTEEAQEAVRNLGIVCAFTTVYNKVKTGADPTSLPRVRVLGDAGLEAFIKGL
ncbi:MAG: polysaccharide deacetylase family protein [Firmicutes bacterium]|nr:polysaccharide deacetylase family protein [Bacillota bacterium]